MVYRGTTENPGFFGVPGDPPEGPPGAPGPGPGAPQRLRAGLGSPAEGRAGVGTGSRRVEMTSRVGEDGESRARARLRRKNFGGRGSAPARRGSGELSGELGSRLQSSEIGGFVQQSPAKIFFPREVSQTLDKMKFSHGTSHKRWINRHFGNLKCAFSKASDSQILTRRCFSVLGSFGNYFVPGKILKNQ